MNRKRVLALILAAVLAVPSNGLAVMAAAPEEVVQQEETVLLDEEESTPETVDEKEDLPEENVTESEEAEEEVHESDLQEEEADLEELAEVLEQSATDGLYVDDDGVLQVTSGVTLTGTITIPAEATEIPAGLFKGTEIEEVITEAGSKLTTIGEEAFSGCKKLKFVSLRNVTNIGNRAFYDCSNLQTVQGSNLESIGDQAFADCGELYSISLKSVKTIGNKAFSNCKKLTANVVFGTVREEDPLKLQSVGDGAFSNCTGFSRVSLENTAEEIVFGTAVFQGCTGLKEIILPKNLTAIPDYTFMSCENLSVVTMNDKVQMIGSQAFKGCKNLKTLTLSKNVETIGSNAFESCSVLENITLGEKLKTIGKGAFTACVKLVTIVIPETVETIEADAFKGCDKLRKVTFNCKDDVTGVSKVKIAETAFPELKDLLTLEGYDGTVEDHAGIHGYKFVRIGTYKIKCSVPDSSTRSGTVEASVTEARKGEIVYVTATPEDGAVVKTITVNGSSLSATMEKVKDDGVVVFSFEMPSAEANVQVTFGKAKELKDYVLETSADPGPDISWYQDANGKWRLSFGRAGQTFGIKLRTDKSSDVIEPWMFDIKSSNSNLVAVSPDGTIRSVRTTKRGSIDTPVTITLTPKNGGTKTTFQVTVEADADAENVTFDFPASRIGKGKVLTDDKSGLPVIRFTKSILSIASRSFQVNLDVTDKSGESMITASKWSVVDSDMVELDVKQSENNKNTLTVKKGASGETAVTVTVDRKEKDEKGNTLDPIKEKFIVQVVDATPRLEEKKITVNRNSALGSKITLVPVYGYTIDPDSLCIKEIVKDGSATTYEPSSFSIVGDRIIAGSMEAGTYNNQYVIEGRLKDDGSTFRVRIPSITVTGTAINPTLKMTGKLNLFYKGGKSCGTVTVSQNLKDETVERYELHADEKTDIDETFSDNFTVEKNEDGQAVISRTNEEVITNSKGKVITSGYLWIYYEGYDDPVKKKITVPTITTKPSLILGTTKVTISSFVENETTYDVVVQDRKTKEEISMDTVDVNRSKTAASIKAVLEDVEIEKEKIHVKFTEAPQTGGKIVLLVQQNSWSAPIELNLSVAVTKNLPKVKLSAATLVLSKESPVGVITAGWDQKEAELANEKNTEDEIELEYAGAPRYRGDAEKIHVTYKDGKIYAELDENASVKGTYKFSFTPKWKYGDNEVTSVRKVSPISVTVKAVTASPVVSVSGKGTINLLNRDVPVVYTPKLSNSTSVVTDVSILEYTKNGTPVEFDETEDALTEEESKIDSSAGHYSKHFKVAFDPETGKVSLYARDSAKFYKADGYKIALNYTLKKTSLLAELLALGAKDTYLTKAMVVTVKQTLPNVSIDTTSATMFAGERYVDRVHTFTLKPATEGAQIETVQWASDTTDAIKEAFDLVYEVSTGKLTLALKNPAVLKQNTTYNLKLEAVYRGQWIDSVDKKKKDDIKEIKNGKIVNISVTINK